MYSKNELRRFAKEQRQNIDINSISQQILQVFFNSNYFLDSINIALYYPYGTELDIKPILKKSDKNFFLPKINSNLTMTFHEYKGEENLIKDNFGIFSPNTPVINPQIIDLWILPALMADRQGGRLGYGKGFYDKFLAKNKINATKIVFIPDELLVDKLPTDNFDISVNILITQSNIITI